MWLLKASSRQIDSETLLMRLPAFIAALGLLSACAATTSPPTHVAAADAAPAQVFPAISTETLKAVTKTLSSDAFGRSEEHTSELQSLMRISYAVFCLKKKKN